MTVAVEHVAPRSWLDDLLVVTNNAALQPCSVVAKTLQVLIRHEEECLWNGNKTKPEEIEWLVTFSDSLREKNIAFGALRLPCYYTADLPLIAAQESKNTQVGGDSITTSQAALIILQRLGQYGKRPAQLDGRTAQRVMCS